MKQEEMVKKHAVEIIKNLVAELIKKNPVEILYNYEDDDQWSIVTQHVYEEDKEISIRLHENGVYDLHLGYYDKEDEFHEVIKPLTEEEKNLLPESLKKLMSKVLGDEEGMRLSGSFLSK